MPNHTCCVPGCNNRCANTKEKGIKYYKFPQANQIMRRVWLRKISRERTFTITANTRICSEHFEGGIKDENNPVPTLFPWKKLPAKKRRPPLGRAAMPQMPPPAKKQRHKHHLQQQNDLVGLNKAVGSAKEDPKDVCVASIAIQCSPELVDRAVQCAKENPKDACTASIAIQCSPELVDRAVQCEGDRVFVHALLEQIECWEVECTSLRAQLVGHTFCIERFAENNHDVAYYTGFPSYEMLMIFCRYLGEKVNHLSLWRGQDTNQSGTPSVSERKLKPIDEFFLCLIRLRLGLQLKDLAFRFNISVGSASRIFTTWINFLYLEFKSIDFQPSREQVDRDMPVCFKVKYPSTCLILDATEIHLETPSLEMQSMTWSSYKNTNTLKGLVGITPSGYISFVSELYCGNISDKKLTAESSVLDTLQQGDGLMADRGFDIGDECASRNINLNIPPFRYGRGQLSAADVVQTRRIPSLRIHVERAIGQIKRFRILESSIPITMCSTINQVFYVCCMLTKFQPPQNGSLLINMF